MSCRTGAGVFDGRMRYDLKLDYKRMENGEGRARLSRARRWSAPSISRRSRATSPTAP